MWHFPCLESLYAAVFSEVSEAPVDLREVGQPLQKAHNFLDLPGVAASKIRTGFGGQIGSVIAFQL